MDLYPAIDLRDGNCVRLYQGDYGRETVYGDDPVSQAKAFADGGAPWIHVVDLDAARSGEPLNRPVVAAIAEAIDVPVQTGGGVRTVDAAKALFDVGVARVVIGTAAIENPDLVAQLTSAGHAVAVGLDGRGGSVAIHGWETDSGQSVVQVAKRFEDMGVAAIIATDIGRDGTLEGPDVHGLTELLQSTSLDIIASGGVGEASHLVDLAKVDVEGRTLAGAIVGRALYEGTVDLPGALAACKG